MRTCVVGAGAIGGWVAARLALAGEEVLALTGRGPIDGLEITEAGETQRAEFARFEGPADLLVIAVKATALGGITESVRPLIGPETIILPMLNGVPWWFVDGEPLASVDPNGRIAAALPPGQIIGCVVHASSSRAAPASSAALEIEVPEQVPEHSLVRIRVKDADGQPCVDYKVWVLAKSFVFAEVVRAEDGSTVFTGPPDKYAIMVSGDGGKDEKAA